MEMVATAILVAGVFLFFVSPLTVVPPLAPTCFPHCPTPTSLLRLKAHDPISIFHISNFHFHISHIPFVAAAMATFPLLRAFFAATKKDRLQDTLYNVLPVFPKPRGTKEQLLNLLADHVQRNISLHAEFCIALLKKTSRADLAALVQAHGRTTAKTKDDLIQQFIDLDRPLLSPVVECTALVPFEPVVLSPAAPEYQLVAADGSRPKRLQKRLRKTWIKLARHARRVKISKRIVVAVRTEVLDKTQSIFEIKQKVLSFRRKLPGNLLPIFTS